MTQPDSRSGKYEDLPTWEELVQLTSWVGQGCPVAKRDYDTRAAVELLYSLLNALPRHLPHYAYGSPEWRAELVRRGQICCLEPQCMKPCIEGSDYCAEHQR